MYETLAHFQQRAYNWLHVIWSKEEAEDKKERNHRFFEEAGELVQSLGMTKEECIQAIEYVYSRPAGAPQQEVGGTFTTLLVLCSVNDMDAEHCLDTELTRIELPNVIEKIRKKQAEKPKFSK